MRRMEGLSVQLRDDAAMSRIDPPMQGMDGPVQVSDFLDRYSKEVIAEGQAVYDKEKQPAPQVRIRVMANMIQPSKDEGYSYVHYLDNNPTGKQPSVKVKDEAIADAPPAAGGAARKDVLLDPYRDYPVSLPVSGRAGSVHYKSDMMAGKDIAGLHTDAIKSRMKQQAAAKEAPAKAARIYGEQKGVRAVPDVPLDTGSAQPEAGA